MYDLTDGNKVVVDQEEYRCYVRHCMKNTKHKFTLALKKLDTNNFAVGIAVLNPNDTDYKKKLGRAVAIGRAVTRPLFFVNKGTANVRSLLDTLDSFFSETKNIQDIVANLASPRLKLKLTFDVEDFITTQGSPQ